MFWPPAKHARGGGRAAMLPLASSQLSLHSGGFKRKSNARLQVPSPLMNGFIKQRTKANQYAECRGERA